jgi:hypothetical protein
MNILSVYNICGINGDNTEWYIKCIESILKQDMKTKVVISSCLNSQKCLSDLKDRFGDDIEICYYKDPYIVNVTFNKTVLHFAKTEKFDGYLFIDSGVLLTDTKSITEMCKHLNDCSMVTLQVDYDTGYESLGFKPNSTEIQIKDSDFLIPLGKACNLHAQIFSNDLLEEFGLIIPDVFAAFCTESTFSFLNAVVGKKWIIVKDIISHHNKAVDGPSSTQPHYSQVFRTTWNNLLYGRDALDFILNLECIRVGIGYEECGNIMLHNQSAYENGLPKDKNGLSSAIKKYFFSNSDELNYNNIDIEVT